MRTTTVLFILLGTAACTGGGAGGGTGDIEAWSGEFPIEAPWLREQMPQGALIYQRIPHPLGLIALPKGNVLAPALASRANIENVIEIQRGLATNLVGASPALGQTPAGALIEHLRSPVEIVGLAVPGPSALVAMTLDLRSNADLEALFAELAAMPPFAGLVGPLDADGIGQIGAPVPVFVRFEEATGRLLAYGGPMATRATFMALLEPAADAASPAMAPLEAQIDDSGQGLFTWLDAAQALTMGGMFMPPEVAQMLRTTGADQLSSIALGAGVADGKGRLKLLLDMGAGDTDRPFPIVSNEITATSVGEPTGMFLLSLPSAGEFARLETLALGAAPPEARGEWNGIKARFREASGVGIEELLSALGPEIIAIGDRAGDYFGIRVRDRALLDDVLGRLAAAREIEIGEHEIDGQSIRHVALPGAIGLPDAAAENGMPPAAALLGRMRNRVYWIAEDDYLYLAGLPQLLIERLRLGADTSIADWLDATQRIDLSSSLLAATGSFRDLPAKTYQAYLGMMQGIADLAGVEYDIWSMPTAGQLGLPERGAIGFGLNLGDPYVSLELSYESHPAELLFGAGGLGAAAAAGVISAIAIPAYQDYTIRAQVSEGLNLAAPARAAVASAWIAAGEMPADRAAAGLGQGPGASGGTYVEDVEIDDGQILVRYGRGAHEAIAGRTLTLTPYATGDGNVLWVCGHAGAPDGLEPIGGAAAATTVPREYLPSGCR